MPNGFRGNDERRVHEYDSRPRHRVTVMIWAFIALVAVIAYVNWGRSE